MTAAFHVLTSMREMAEVFHVGRETVKRWYEEGAPIVRSSPKRFKADPEKLWEWLMARELSRREAKDGLK